MGLIGVAIGVLLVWKSDKVVESVGPIEWAEKFFGPGRSSNGYQVVGIVIIFFSFAIMTNLIGGMLKFVFSGMLGIK